MGQFCVKTKSMKKLTALFLLFTSFHVFAQDKRQLADSLYYNDHFSQARELFAELLLESPEDALLTYRYGYVNYRLGELDRGIELIKKALELNDDKVPALTYTGWSRLAKIYALKNEKETALMWLEKAVDKGYNGLSEFDEEPHFENIRSTAKFQELREKLERKAFPCKYDERFSMFDFWIGEWDVYRTGTVNLVGHSFIEPVSGGCAILENWRSLVTPHEGKSMNYLNSEKGYWEQFWQGSQNDRQHFLQGKYEDGAMRFVYTDQEGKAGRLIFFSVNRDTVRQFSEIETEKGSGEFRPAYDLTYKRKVN